MTTGAPQETPATQGVRRIVAIVAMLLPCLAVPYVVPGLERYRVWERGDPLPFAHVLELRPFTAGAPPAGAGGGRERRLTDDELLETALGEHTAAPEPAVSAARDPLRIPASEWRGLPRPIEDDAGAMRHFYAALRETARATPGATTRVLVYSDSINASDRVTSALRHRLQDRFGDAGKGFVPIVPGWRYQVHQDVDWAKRGGWRTSVVNTNDEPNGRYGLGGVLAKNAGPGARATFGAEVARYRLFHQAGPGGGDVLLSVDGADPLRVATHAPAVEDRVADVTVPDGPHDLELRVEGEARLYGLVLERDAPGVVVDGLMLVGAYTRILSHFDPDHWAKQIELRRPDLLVFWLGGNDASSRAPLTGFASGYASSIRAARRGRPEASCLVLAALDATDARRRRLSRLVDAQRRAAREAGCAFFDTYDATGGRGTMRRWSRTSPRLAAADGKHLTNAGARVVGTLLYQALLQGYDAWLATQPPAPLAHHR